MNWFTPLAQRTKGAEEKNEIAADDTLRLLGRIRHNISSAYRNLQNNLDGTQTRNSSNDVR